MSSFVTNCSINVGGDLKEEKSYIKLKIGRGEAEGEALHQLVQSGTGKIAAENEFLVYIRTTKTDFTKKDLSDYMHVKNEFDSIFSFINDMTQEAFDQMVTEGDVVNDQKWFTIDLTKTGKDNVLGEKVKEMSQMFNKVKANIAFEFAFKSSIDFTGLSMEKELPDYSWDDAIQWWKESRWPSISRMFKNFSMSISSDMDSCLMNEIVGVMNSITGEDFPLKFCDLVENLDNLEMRQTLGDALEESKTLDFLMKPFSQIWAFLWQDKAFNNNGLPPAGFDDMRIIFFANKDTYIDISTCLPGYGQWLTAGRALKKENNS